MGIFNIIPEYHHAQDIVNIRGISKAYVSCSLDKLVKRGLVERRVDNEKSVVVIVCL
ncbi:MAG: helix-turn-helix domain-containing protein [Thomasclavelia ramosa]